MRFGDGAWRMQSGVTVVYPARVDEMEQTRLQVTFHVSDRRETSRGATLEGHRFTVCITSPGAGVFRVRVAHHRGRRQRGPHYCLQLEEHPLAVEDAVNHVTIRSAHAQLVITKDPWTLELRDDETGELLTSSPFKALGLMEKDGFGTHLREQLTLGVGEQVYGLGERFSAFARNGQSVDMWNADCGTCSDKGYKDVPFFLTSRGWGLFVNDPGRVSFEIGTEQVERAQFSVPGENLDYFLICGPTPKQVLTRYGALAGRPRLPPAWSFGLWLTTSFLTEYDEPTVMHFVEGMKSRDLPLHVFHFDCFWMRPHHWVDFEWDREAFPDPTGMLTRLKERGLHVCVWINPYIAERSCLFDEAMSQGYLLRRPNGDVYQRHWWQAGMAYVDFTNPSAVRWFQSKLRALCSMGVDCFKADFGEEIPTDVVYFDDSDPMRMHNYYSYLYNRAVFEVLEQARGRGQAVLFSRSATATCQQFPVHWGGDCYGTFESMAESLRGGLSLALSGFGFWSHDIGGFEKQASSDVYKRWVAFGLLSSHSRLHGSTSYRVPWLYDEEAVDVLRLFTKLKCRLMPYLMQAAVAATSSSIPMMRSMLLEFPDDPTCRTLDRQYLLGPALLVAPVFHERDSEFYLPEGDWTHLMSGERRSGHRWYQDPQSFLTIPLYLRPNHVVPMGATLDQVDYDYARQVRLVLGQLDGVTPMLCPLYNRDGVLTNTFEISQQPGRVTVQNSSHRNDFEVQLPWAVGIARISGGEVLDDSPRSALPGDPGGLVIRATATIVEIVFLS